MPGWNQLGQDAAPAALRGSTWSRGDAGNVPLVWQQPWPRPLWRPAPALSWSLRCQRCQGRLQLTGRCGRTVPEGLSTQPQGPVQYLGSWRWWQGDPRVPRACPVLSVSPMCQGRLREESGHRNSTGCDPTPTHCSDLTQLNVKCPINHAAGPPRAPPCTPCAPTACVTPLSLLEVTPVQAPRFKK